MNSKVQNSMDVFLRFLFGMSFFLVKYRNMTFCGIFDFDVCYRYTSVIELCYPFKG